MKACIREITIKGCGIVVSALSASVARATIIYSSSGAYSIQEPTDDNVQIQHAATDATVGTGGLSTWVFGGALYFQVMAHCVQIHRWCTYANKNMGYSQC